MVRVYVEDVLPVIGWPSRSHWYVVEAGVGDSVLLTVRVLPTVASPLTVVRPENSPSTATDGAVMPTVIAVAVRPASAVGGSGWYSVSPHSTTCPSAVSASAMLDSVSTLVTTLPSRLDGTGSHGTSACWTTFPDAVTTSVSQ